MDRLLAGLLACLVGAALNLMHWDSLEPRGLRAEWADLELAVIAVELFMACVLIVCTLCAVVGLRHRYVSTQRSAGTQAFVVLLLLIGVAAVLLGLPFARQGPWSAAYIGVLMACMAGSLALAVRVAFIRRPSS